MSFNNKKNSDYHSLGSSKNKDGKENNAQSTLKPSKRSRTQNGKDEIDNQQKLVNYNKDQEQKIAPHYSGNGESKTESADELILKPKNSLIETAEKIDTLDTKLKIEQELSETIVPAVEEDYAAELKERKREKQAKKDFDILKNESWVVRNGHHLTYLGLFCFTILVFFRPYELIPGLGFLSATAF
jgi:hypothetical protein